MALKDLEGKRTGRPRGARTTSRLRRDAAWAYRHLDHPDARPPSPGAKMWAQLAREEPGRFLSCVALLEGEGPGQDRDGGAEEKVTPAGRLMKLFVHQRQLVAWLTGDETSRIENLPPGFEVVGGEAAADGKGLFLTIRSESFPDVVEGEGVPQFAAVYGRKHW